MAPARSLPRPLLSGGGRGRLRLLRDFGLELVAVTILPHFVSCLDVEPPEETDDLSQKWGDLDPEVGGHLKRHGKLADVDSSWDHHMLRLCDECRIVAESLELKQRDDEHPQV